MTDKGNGVPAWVKGVGVLVGTLGLPAFLLLWLMGAFHGFMPSPVTAEIREHDHKTTKVQRLICAGVWKSSPEIQEKCWE